MDIWSVGMCAMEVGKQHYRRTVIETGYLFWFLGIQIVEELSQ